LAFLWLHHFKNMAATSPDSAASSESEAGDTAFPAAC